MTVAEYNHCVDRYADGIYRFVLKNIKDSENAKDIVQDTFEKIWIKHDTIDYNKAKSYLFTTAYHSLIDYTRKSKNMEPLEKSHEIESTQNCGFSDLKENLEWALARIPQIHRMVIMLRDYEGYSYEEIGQIAGLSESQVKVYIYRARMALKKLIRTPEVLI